MIQSGDKSFFIESVWSFWAHLKCFWMPQMLKEYAQVWLVTSQIHRRKIQQSLLSTKTCSFPQKSLNCSFHGCITTSWLMLVFFPKRLLWDVVRDRIHRVIWSFWLSAWLFLCSHPCVLVLFQQHSQILKVLLLWGKKKRKEKDNIALIYLSISFHAVYHLCHKAHILLEMGDYLCLVVC